MAGKTKQTPRYRDVTSFGKVVLWQDIRDGASAGVFTVGGELTGEALQRLFRIARSMDIPVTRKRPLIVYGSVCRVGESETWTLVQMGHEELSALLSDMQPEQPEAQRQRAGGEG